MEGAISIEAGKLKLPKFGLVNCSEKITELGIKNAVISRQANHWFVSFKTLNVPQNIIGIEQKQVVGVDLGIKTLATLSDGKTFENIRPYKKYKRKLRIAQRKVSKKFVKGAKTQSKNYKKASQKVAKIPVSYTHLTLPTKRIV